MERTDFGDSQWEDLRKEARRLESQVDVKLAAFSKMVAGFQTGESYGHGSNSLANSGAAAAELEALLQRLSDLNEAMSGAVSGAGAGQWGPRKHTVARHRDILGEFTQEFRRTRGMVANAMEHGALLSGASMRGLGGSGGFLSEGGGGHPLPSPPSSSTSLLRERTAIHSSVTQINDVINQAQATMGALTQQQSLFDGVFSKMSQMGDKFPVMNVLLGAIRRKRSKDTLVLSGVIAVCVLFLIVYSWSK